MKSVLQKALITVTILTIFSIKATRVAAQEPWRMSDTRDCFKVADDQRALCLASQASAVFHAGQTTILEQIAGCVDGVTKPEGDCPKGNETGSQPNRIINQMSLFSASDRVIAALYQNAPAGTIEGLADLGQTFGILPKVAYAQGPGIGFAGLAPLLPIWKVFRNIAYLLIAIIMVVIGFMVMFRKKIDPKTVVTVQNAIPGIIVTLLLITFSYAIVGIMIDLMYFTIALLLAMLVPVGNAITDGETFDSLTASRYLNAHWWNAVAMIFNAGIRTTDDIVGFMGLGGFVGEAGVGVGVAALLAGIFTVGGPLPYVIGGAIAILPLLLVALAIIFAVFRILFMLLSSYINIIISLLTAPLQLLMGAIPGSNAFSSWFMNLVSNLAAFPITAAFFLIATMLARYENVIKDQQKLWSPPFIGGGTQGVSGIIALGLLFTIPTIVNSIKESLKTKPPVAAGPGAILGPIGSGVGGLMQMGYQMMFIKQAIGGEHAKPPHTQQATDTQNREEINKAVKG